MLGHKGNASQNDTEIPSYSSQNGRHQEQKQQIMRHILSFLASILNFPLHQISVFSKSASAFNSFKIPLLCKLDYTPIKRKILFLILTLYPQSRNCCKIGIQQIYTARRKERFHLFACLLHSQLFLKIFLSGCILDTLPLVCQEIGLLQL